MFTWDQIEDLFSKQVKHKTLKYTYIYNLTFTVDSTQISYTIVDQVFFVVLYSRLRTWAQQALVIRKQREKATKMLREQINIHFFNQ